MRMSREDAHAAVGREFAGHIYNGGRWVTGKIVGYCEAPTVTIERDNGERIHVAITTIGPFLIENQPQTGRPT